MCTHDWIFDWRKERRGVGRVREREREREGERKEKGREEGEGSRGRWEGFRRQNNMIK